jgi:serine phosphatase RsbU (regulator of sigma subunit)/anti-anti-sigma regulatory factor
VTSHENREDPHPSILIIDDDEDLRALLVRGLRSDEPQEIEEAASAAEARARLERRAFDVVITDLSMPGESGLSLMQWSHEHCPGASWIVLTGYGTLDTAVQALQLGAFDFLSKPIQAIEPLRKAVRNALAHQRLLAERDRLHAELRDSNDRLKQQVEQVEDACRLLQQQADTIRADLQRAAIIQQALLPHSTPSLSHFHVNALYRPSQNVGGDLYDVARVDDRHIVLLVADASGHGLSAAMLAVLFRSRLPLVDPDTGDPRDPRDVFRDVNCSLCEAFPKPGLFLTATYCLLDTERGEATIASAGHPPLLWLRRNGAIERIFHTGPALGLTPAADFAQQRVVLEPGESLLFYSDGLYEQFPGEKDNPSAAIAAALEPAAQTGAGVLERLLAPYRVLPQDGAAPEDDVTVLMLTASPGTSALDNGAPPPLPEPRAVVRDVQTLVGADARRTILSVQGRGDWAQSSAFGAECTAAIGAGRDVMVDFALCRQLDSTFLGTIHLLCMLAHRAGVEFRLQGVTPPVEALFEELGMENVRDHMVPSMLPLPMNMEPLGAAEPDPLVRAMLLLRAHEGLAALSDRNRQEFGPLLTQLRQELATLPR